MTFTPPDPFTTRPTLRGTHGMAASTHWLASATAHAVLERGGNAFDAAVAAAFVLHVVEPHLNGPGGDLTALIATADDPRPRVLAGQGPAPAAATIEHLRAEGLDEIPGAGLLAAAVPGAVPAWFRLLDEHGTWELADVLAFAIGYAREGHPLLPVAAATIARVRDLFAEHWPTSAALWLDDGDVPAAGALVRNEAYARTLERLVAAGTDATGAAGTNATGTDATGADATGRRARIRAALDAWSRGFVASAIDDFVRVPSRHSSGTDHPGVLAAADLAAFEPDIEEPTSLEFRGWRIVKSGPWAQGPVLLQALAILDAVGDEDRLDPSTAVGVHTITEAMKLALADRDAYYGDPGPSPELLATLLSAEYARERAALIDDRASAESRPGSPAGAPPWRPPFAVPGSGSAGAAGTGEPTVDRRGVARGDTCHLDVVDRWGNVVSATPSGGWLQSSPTIPELGFCLGTRLQMMWLDPESPSALAPGRRPRSTLSPTLLVRDGRVVEALGTPGGDQQDQWQLPYLLRRIVGGYSPQEAIDAPTFHTTSHVSSFAPRVVEPGGLVVEDRMPPGVAEELAERGHVVTRSGPWTLGRLSAVGVEDGVLFAAANARGAQGYAVGR